MSLEQLIGPKSKKVLKTEVGGRWGRVKDKGANPEECPMAKAGTIQTVKSPKH